MTGNALMIDMTSLEETGILHIVEKRMAEVLLLLFLKNIKLCERRGGNLTTKTFGSL